jgi:hypothetical protein
MKVNKSPLPPLIRGGLPVGVGDDPDYDDEAPSFPAGTTAWKK